MKKLFFTLLVLVFFTSCSIEEDEPIRLRGYAPVTSVNLPEYFTLGETYELEVSYERKNVCHTPGGLSVTRGGMSGEERRKIYVAGITIYSKADNTCEKGEETLIETGVFTITIDEEEPFTFYLWIGTDTNGENLYDIVEVPVEPMSQDHQGE